MADEFTEDDGSSSDRPQPSPRSAEILGLRLQDLVETLIDHPNRSEIVAREMGWNALADVFAADKDDENEGFRMPNGE